MLRHAAQKQQRIRVSGPEPASTENASKRLLNQVVVIVRRFLSEQHRDLHQCCFLAVSQARDGELNLQLRQRRACRSNGVHT
jgi:hypothetical protein